MRKFVIAAAAAGAALALSACSEGTEEAATETVDSAAADMEANTDAAMEDGAAAMEDGAAAMEEGAVEVEAAVEGETEEEAAAE